MAAHVKKSCNISGSSTTELCKRRSTSFLTEERRLLVDLARSFIHIIESNRTDAATFKLKDVAWENITNQFNVQSPVSVWRTTVQLQTCYNEMKRLACTDRLEKHLMIVEECTTGSSEKQSVEGTPGIMTPTSSPHSSDNDSVGSHSAVYEADYLDNTSISAEWFRVLDDQTVVVAMSDETMSMSEETMTASSHMENLHDIAKQPSHSHRASVSSTNTHTLSGTRQPSVNDVKGVPSPHSGDHSPQGGHPESKKGRSDGLQSPSMIVDLGEDVMTSSSSDDVNNRLLNMEEERVYTRTLLLNKHLELKVLEVERKKLDILAKRMRMKRDRELHKLVLTAKKQELDHRTRVRRVELQLKQGERTLQRLAVQAKFVELSAVRKQ